MHLQMHNGDQKYLQKTTKKILPCTSKSNKNHKILQKYEENCRSSSPKTNLIMSTATGEHILPPTGKGHP